MLWWRGLLAWLWLQVHHYFVLPLKRSNIVCSVRQLSGVMAGRVVCAVLCGGNIGAEVHGQVVRHVGNMLQ